jgi:RimJ/RimL family protein N-acetyltransferase
MTTLTITPRFDPPRTLPTVPTVATVSTGWHRSLPDLLGSGFRLREPRLSDVDQLTAAFSGDAASVLGVGVPGTSDQWMHFVARARAGRAAGHAACFVVVPDGTPDVCGLILLQRLAPGSRVATVSFGHANTGRAADLPVRSLACALAFAFRAVGVGRVEGRACSPREVELVRRLGAVTEGVLRGSHPVADGFADQTLWAVLATDWDQCRLGAKTEPVRMELERPVSGGPTTGDGTGDRPPAWTMRLPTLKGQLVTMREIDLLDAAVLMEALEPADLEISIEPVPTSPDQFRRYISWVQSQRSAGRAAGFAIVPRGSRRAAGLVQIRLDDVSGAAAEWGLVLAQRFRGTGAALEAAQLLAGFAFETLGVHRLEARASGIDPRSTGLFRKMGAVREAHLRLSFVRGNEVLDDDLWSILKPDWRGVHPGRRRRQVASATGGQRVSVTTQTKVRPPARPGRRV